MNSGIISIGAYVPRARIARATIAKANAWANPGLRALGKGSRTFCGPDEDSVTMAVEAARSCLGGQDAAPDVIRFASTTAPFSDRANAVIINEALNLGNTVRCADASGFLGSGIAALIDGLSQESTNLVIASDRRLARPGSVSEMNVGHGAAAVMTGLGDCIARCIGTYVIAADFVDHYRSSDMETDYYLEERWVRDEGHLRLIPSAIAKILDDAAFVPADIDRIVMAGVEASTARKIVESTGFDSSAIVDNLQEDCGATGAAHALLMLRTALANANAGERILVVDFAQGVQAILLEATAAISAANNAPLASREIMSGRVEENYVRFLAACDQLKIDRGLRAERDNRTAMSVFNRHRADLTGFVGGKCRRCGSRQFPKGTACTNPECRAIGEMDDEPYRDKVGRVKSYTEDWLAISSSAPLRYGNVAFGKDGGVIMMEFTDFDSDDLKVGSDVRFVFRIKDKDPNRGFRRYFWKAAPANELGENFDG